MTKAAATKPVRKALHAAAEASAEAREQADEYDSPLSSTELTLDDGTTVIVPPHPDYGMLDDDQMEAYDDLRFAIDALYDRDEDIFIPEQRLKDSNGVETGVVLPSTTRPGNVKIPYRQDGVLVKPPYQVRLAQIALGPEEYARLKAGGRNASDVLRIWNEQQIKFRERQQRDSKSAGSTVGLAAVPPPDSE